MYEEIHVERHDRILLVTIDRPSALNAVSRRTAAELSQAFDELENEDDLWVGILTGAGRAFCAGADLKEEAVNKRNGAARPLNPPGGFGGITERTIRKPTIGAINGLAYGGGMEIALALDLLVCSETAQFCLPEVKVGLAAGAGGLLRLPRQIPVRLAMEMALTGSPISAAQALSWGMVNAVVPSHEVLPEAFKLAQSIVANAPMAVRASKAVILNGLDRPMLPNQAAWDVNSRYLHEVRISEDAKEGTQAFVDKRPPVWRNR